MNRQDIYFLSEGEESTFTFDETLPPLPLPELEDTLARYYESLKPFGTPDELRNSQIVIDDFKKGVGSRLHKALKERAGKQKNWLEGWWEDYGYHLLRVPLQPYTCMTMPACYEKLGIPETRENRLKTLARVVHHTLEFWTIIRNESLKPLSSGGGKIKYSSALYKKFFSTSKIPGEEIDHIDTHFKSVSEGPTPTHTVVLGKGRIFTFECLNEDGSYLSPQQCLAVLQRIDSILNESGLGECVPVLTNDDRTNWAKNRNRLIEISPHNKEILRLIESSVVVLTMDENEPFDYEDVCKLSLEGDFISKWADRSSILVSYKNGRVAYMGEHSAYDGTISISYGLFIDLSLYEVPEPDDWYGIKVEVPCINELNFDLDDSMKQEIEKVNAECDLRKKDVLVAYTNYTTYGKEFLKQHKLHPDSFVQTVIQLTFYKLHKEIVPIYETALMRHYYNGRTETLRSCSTVTVDFMKSFMDELNEDCASSPSPSPSSPSSTSHLMTKLTKAVNHHNHLMNEARKGNGVDRHLFGLWCVAYENKMEIPEFYFDPMYSKSGGGGNFVLSTSTLGYTPNCGLVAPMVLDGYGVFYSITDDV
ncbi:CROT family protein [Megaselia abdita]